MPKISYVYFIKDCQRKQFKVGRSINPEARCKALQTGCGSPLLLVCYFEGDHQLEAYIHRKLAAHRIRGEWFAAPAVQEYIHSVDVARWSYICPPPQKKARHRNRKYVDARRDTGAPVAWLPRRKAPGKLSDLSPPVAQSALARPGAGVAPAGPRQRGHQDRGPSQSHHPQSRHPCR